VLTITASTLAGLNVPTVLAAAEQWGFSARNCLRIARDQIPALKLDSAVTEAAKVFATDPEYFLKIGRDDNTSHSLIGVRPAGDGNSRQIHKAEILTTHIQDIIAEAVANVDVAKQGQFFTLISSHPWFKSSSGYLFEKCIHTVLTAPSAPGEGLMCKVVYSSDDSALEIPKCSLVVPLNGITSLRESHKHALPFYWRPTFQSFPFVDAIICTFAYVILLQCTVSVNHGANAEALRKILGAFRPTFLRQRRVALVWTVDSDTTALRLASPKFKRLTSEFGLSIYSCVYLPSFRSPLADTVNDVSLQDSSYYFAEYDFRPLKAPQAPLSKWPTLQGSGGKELATSGFMRFLPLLNIYCQAINVY
jgi:hypothetical protein